MRYRPFVPPKTLRDPDDLAGEPLDQLEEFEPEELEGLTVLAAEAAAG